MDRRSFLVFLGAFAGVVKAQPKLLGKTAWETVKPVELQPTTKWAVVGNVLDCSLTLSPRGWDCRLSGRTGPIAAVITDVSGPSCETEVMDVTTHSADSDRVFCSYFPVRYKSNDFKMQIYDGHRMFLLTVFMIGRPAWVSSRLTFSARITEVAFLTSCVSGRIIS